MYTKTKASKPTLLTYYYIFYLQKYARVKKGNNIIIEGVDTSVSDEDFDKLDNSIKENVRKIFSNKCTFENKLFRYVIKNKKFPLTGILYDWVIINWDKLSKIPYFPGDISTWNPEDQKYIEELEKFRDGLEYNKKILSDIKELYNSGRINRQILSDFEDVIKNLK